MPHFHLIFSSFELRRLLFYKPSSACLLSCQAFTLGKGVATTLSKELNLSHLISNHPFGQAEQPPALGPDSAQATDSHHSPTQQDLELMDSLDDMLLEMPDPFGSGEFCILKGVTEDPKNDRVYRPQRLTRISHWQSLHCPMQRRCGFEMQQMLFAGYTQSTE